MFNLYETILGLCESRGISVYKMSKESGVSRSVMTELKSGRTQSLSTESLQKIASYFNVPVDFLLDIGEPSQRDIPPEQPATDNQLLFALYGEVPEEISDAEIDEIKQYAEMVLLRKRNQKKGDYSD